MNHIDGHQVGRSTYRRQGCRCDGCRADNAAYSRQRRAALSTAWVPRVGTARRLQALSAAGWSLTAIAAHAHVHFNSVWALRTHEGDRILRAVADHITAVYDDLAGRTPPGRYLTRSIRLAEANGWAEPWRWEGVDIDDPTAEPTSLTGDFLDEIAIQEAMTGRQVKLTSAERTEAVRRLTAAGKSATTIAGLLRTTTRSVTRRRAAEVAA